jgi:hypothetical protein
MMAVVQTKKNRLVCTNKTHEIGLVETYSARLPSGYIPKSPLLYSQSIIEVYNALYVVHTSEMMGDGGANLATEEII